MWNLTATIMVTSPLLWLPRQQSYIDHEVDFIKNMGGDFIFLFSPPELCSKLSL